MLAYAGGDAGAFERLYSKHKGPLFRYVLRSVKGRGEAEELFQEIWMKVIEARARYAPRAKFTTWLHAVASNSARSTYRSLKRRSAELPSDDLPASADPRTTSVIAGSRLDLLDALEILAATHPLLVEALVLRDIQELDYAEIALLMDLPLGTVKSRIHQARKTIQPLLIEKL